MTFSSTYVIISKQLLTSEQRVLNGSRTIRPETDRPETNRSGQSAHVIQSLVDALLLDQSPREPIAQRTCRTDIGCPMHLG